MPDYQSFEETNLCEPPPAQPAHDNDQNNDAERRTNDQPPRNRDIWPKHPPGLK